MQIQRKIVYCIFLFSALFLVSLIMSTKKNTSFASGTFEQICKKNLSRSEDFLASLAHNPSIQVLVPHKLYYEILKPGVSLNTTSPLSFRYKITTLDNLVVADTYADLKPKQIHTSNAILGLSKGIQNIMPGEKRKLYIHPDFAFRKIGIFTPPQSLLIIEIEAVQA